MPTELLTSVATGGGIATLFQIFKGEWGRWPTLILSLLAAGSAGYGTGGVEGAIVAATSSLATHAGLFSNTSLGKGLKWRMLPRILRLISNVTKTLADTLGKQGETPKPQ